VDLGSWDEALASIGSLVPLLEEAGDIVCLLYARDLRCQVMGRRGTLTGALDEAVWITDQARENDTGLDLCLVLPTAAAIHALVGDASGAVSLLAELDAIAGIREDTVYASSLPGALRTALTAGDPGLARRLAEGVEATLPILGHALASARAILAEADGACAQAAKAYTEAADRWATFGVPWEQAHALLGRGRCLLATGDTAEATPPLREAREIFARLEAVPALAECDELLARTTARSS
jgi:hypothetical protein